MKCTNPGCTGAMNPAGQDYCQCQRCGTTAPLRDDSIPPAVREAAVDNIPRSSLPALPEEAMPPFVVKRSTPTNQWFVCGREDEIVAETSYEKYATFLAALLNAVYGGGEGKS